MAEPIAGPTPELWTGAVLTGGRSRRMGRDKASLPIDGRPMAERVAIALRDAGAAEVFAVGEFPGSATVDLAVVADDQPGAGPLGGVRTALAAAQHELVVVLACDLRDPSLAAIAALVRAANRAPEASLVVPVVEGREQWLHAAWRRSGRAALDAAWAAGHRSLHAAAAHVERVVRYGAPPAGLRDADRPADLPHPLYARAVQREEPVPTIDVDELARLHEQDILLIDVRQPDEYEEFHVPGASLIPLGDVPRRLDEIPRDRRVYCICRTGGRSHRAAEFLLGNGFDAVNVAGGSLAWSEAGHPTATGAASG
jgi:molybdopterin-guanine dinucleotide biosynthesis protein A/rhodanese-related sulfurtransferase